MLVKIIVINIYKVNYKYGKKELDVAYEFGTSI